MNGLSIAELQGRVTITVPEAARVLRISRDGAYRAVAAGELPSLRLGRRIVVPVPALIRLLGADSDALGGDAA